VRRPSGCLRRVPLIALLVAGGAGCDRLGRGDDDGERLKVSWTGSDTGGFETPAVAEWCDSLRVLEIRAIRGDSGLAVVIFPRDTVRPDSYPVLLPERADSARPSAGVGIRWFAETAIKGFQGDQGSVVVEQAGERVTGRLRARMRSVTDGSRLELEGRFQSVRVGPATRGCVPRPEPHPPDSG
jgi:hypothetical protein